MLLHVSPPRFAFFLWPLRTLRTVKPLSIPPRPRAVQLYTSTVGCSHAFLRECEYRDCSDQSVRACVTRREDGRHRHSRLRLTHHPHWAAPRHTARGPERGVGSPYLLRRSSAARYVPCASWVAPEACGRNGNRHGRTRATSGRRASASLWRRRGNMRRKCKYVARVRVGRSLPVCNVKNTVIIIGVSHGPGSAAAYTRACSAALRGRRRRSFRAGSTGARSVSMSSQGFRRRGDTTAPQPPRSADEPAPMLGATPRQGSAGDGFPSVVELARAARELDCTEAEASGSVSPDGDAAG